MAFEICVFRLVIILLALAHFQKVVHGIVRRNNYNISDIEDQCHDPYTTYTYFLGSNNMSSSIKLRAYKDLDITNSLYCHFNIRPPSGYSVVVNLEKFQLGFNLNNYCSNAFLEVEGDNFKKKKFCGSSVEGSSFYLGKEARLYYHAGSFLRNKGFTLVATAYSKGCYYTTPNFKCANGNCIWSGLVKDGVNNCGDNSDETTILQGRVKPIIKPKPRVKPPPVWITSHNNNDKTTEKDMLPFLILAICVIVTILVIIYKVWKLLYMNVNEQSGTTPDAQAPSQRSMEPFTVMASRTNSAGDIAMLDSPPPPSYSTVMTEEMKNPPFQPSPPSYSSVISSNANHRTITRRKSLLSISDTENTKKDTAVKPISDCRDSPSAPYDLI